jgi:hypothetical protein
VELDSAEEKKKKLVESEEKFREKGTIYFSLWNNWCWTNILVDKKTEEFKQLDAFYQKEKERLFEKETTLENLQVRSLSSVAFERVSAHCLGSAE